MPDESQGQDGAESIEGLSDQMLLLVSFSSASRGQVRRKGGAVASESWGSEGDGLAYVLDAKTMDFKEVPIWRHRHTLPPTLALPFSAWFSPSTIVGWIVSPERYVQVLPLVPLTGTLFRNWVFACDPIKMRSPGWALIQWLVSLEEEEDRRHREGSHDSGISRD